MSIVIVADDSAADDGWSIAEESARLWLVDECTAQERGWAVREGGKSWLALMWRVERLRPPLAFTSSGDGVVLSEEGAPLPTVSSTRALSIVGPFPNALLDRGCYVWQAPWRRRVANGGGLRCAPSTR
jgi:hypothetical protein